MSEVFDRASKNKAMFEKMSSEFVDNGLASMDYILDVLNGGAGPNLVCLAISRKESEDLKWFEREYGWDEQETFHKALAILVRQHPKQNQTHKEPPRYVTKTISLESPISGLGLCTRTRNAICRDVFIRGRDDAIRTLYSYTRDEWYRVWGMGVKSFHEIDDALIAHGLESIMPAYPFTAYGAKKRGKEESK